MPYQRLRILLALIRFLPLTAIWLQVTVHSPAQSPTPSTSPVQLPLRFEVATIRAHRFAGDEPSNRRMLPGGRFVATATTVRTLLRIAFATDENRMSGAPGWVDSETFDINATTANQTEVVTPEQFQQVILSLLEDRFGLKFHRVREEGAVYRLEADKPGKLGPALKPSTSDSQPDMSSNSNGTKSTMRVSQMSMKDVAAALRRPAGRPVEDHTGINGKFDFQIEWANEETPDSAVPSLFAVVQEQLGLKLRSAKGPVERVVVDHLDHPTAN